MAGRRLDDYWISHGAGQVEAVGEVYARRFLRDMLAAGQPVGLDTETVGCDPTKESPVLRADCWCLSLAFRVRAETGDPVFGAVIPGDALKLGWVIDLLEAISVVGTNIWGYDRHVLRNSGIHLRRIVGDTVRMSRLLDPSTVIDEHGGHGLKAWAERLGIPHPSDYRSLCSVPHKGPVKSYKRDRLVYDRKTDLTVHYTAGAEYQTFSHKRTVLLPVDEVYGDYPSRQKKIIEYALADAKSSLLVYEHLHQRLLSTGGTGR